MGNLEHWDNNRKLVVLKLNYKDQALNFRANDPIASKINDSDQLKDLRKNLQKQPYMLKNNKTFQL